MPNKERSSKNSERAIRVRQIIMLIALFIAACGEVEATNPTPEPGVDSPATEVGGFNIDDVTEEATRIATEIATEASGGDDGPEIEATAISSEEFITGVSELAADQLGIDVEVVSDFIESGIEDGRGGIHPRYQEILNQFVGEHWNVQSFGIPDNAEDEVHPNAFLSITFGHFESEHLWQQMTIPGLGENGLSPTTFTPDGANAVLGFNDSIDLNDPDWIHDVNPDAPVFWIVLDDWYYGVSARSFIREMDRLGGNFMDVFELGEFNEDDVVSSVWPKWGDHEFNDFHTHTSSLAAVRSLREEQLSGIVATEKATFDVAGLSLEHPIHPDCVEQFPIPVEANGIGNFCVTFDNWVFGPIALDGDYEMIIGAEVWIVQDGQNVPMLLPLATRNLVTGEMQINGFLVEDFDEAYYDGGERAWQNHMRLTPGDALNIVLAMPTVDLSENSTQGFGFDGTGFGPDDLADLFASGNFSEGFGNIIWPAIDITKK